MCIFDILVKCILNALKERGDYNDYKTPLKLFEIR